MLLSWLASFPADRVARSLAERQVHTRMAELLFVFPPWLTTEVPLLVGALTMLAAFYPARRPARVNPNTSLRHEGRPPTQCAASGGDPRRAPHRPQARPGRSRFGRASASFSGPDQNRSSNPRSMPWAQKLVVSNREAGRSGPLTG